MALVRFSRLRFKPRIVEVRSLRLLSYIIACLFAIVAVPPSQAQQVIEKLVINGSVTIPRVSRPPTLEDFLSMKPPAEFADGRMAKVDKLYQRNPHDMAPVSQKTEIYLGYDQKNLYAVFVCFDSEPRKIRAHMAKREDGFGDENAEIMLDTFTDQRRAYGFMSNPLGVQSDGIWTEGQGWDMSFDTIWNSRGKLTEEGYVVWMSIPFRSLRFPSRPQQSWGMILNRDIPRMNEETYWPQYSAKVEGRMNQEGKLEGLESISPGRNMQFIPHASLRSYRAPDLRDATAPRYERKDLKGEMGLDSKIILKDSLVLDSTVKPDFSQVESDEPQTTANRRFETFFPEKRPFFIENAGFFQTPIDLVFTRRIADPDFGVRLTGKTGPYSIGVLFADDKSPGRELPDLDPLFDSRAYFNIVRVQRDISKQSTLGMIYTDREYHGAYNRVGGIDGRIKFNANWVTNFQAVTSSTGFDDKTTSGGPAFYADIARSGRSFTYSGTFSDTSTGFLTEPGFFQRPDYRYMSQSAKYTFRPKESPLLAHGVFFNVQRAYDHQGTLLSSVQQAEYEWQFKGQNNVELGAAFGSEGIRPSDFAALTREKQYDTSEVYAYWESQHFSKFGFHVFLEHNNTPSYVTAGINDSGSLGQAPRRVHDDRIDIGTTIKPISRLRIDNKYLLERLYDPSVRLVQLNAHVIRSKWNYQFNRELSLRFIGQYNANLANSTLTSLQTTKGFNADFLLTYLVHPGTAVYVGYNGNLANVDPNLRLDADSNLIRTNRFVNDSRQFFVKISYLFRY